MMRAALLPILLVLAGCGRHGDPGDAEAANGTGLSVRAGDGGEHVAIDMDDGNAAIDVPGFSGKIRMPGLDLASGDLDIDGMRLAPGTKVGKVDVDGGNGGGTVRIAFANPRAPAALIGYYADAAQAAGYAVAARTGTTLRASKADGKAVTIEAVAAGSGSTGTVVVGGAG